MTAKMKDELRARVSAVVVDALKETYGEALQTAGGTFYVPCLDADGNEAWAKVSIIIPNADEAEGTDGYSLAEEYSLKVEAATEKKAKAKAEAEAKKAKAEAKKALKSAQKS